MSGLAIPIWQRPVGDGLLTGKPYSPRVTAGDEFAPLGSADGGSMENGTSPQIDARATHTYTFEVLLLSYSILLDLIQGPMFASHNS